MSNNLERIKNSLRRCGWVNNDPLIIEYHDKEWGVSIHDDQVLFEFLILEGTQAGLSWTTILRKRENYRRAFDNFVPAEVASYDMKKVKELLADPSIVRNRRKITAAIDNAKAFLKIQKEFGSFDSYIWKFVGGRPIRNGWKELAEVPVVTPESKLMSLCLKERGFKFVGPTICYAFMQAVGMVNDHTVDCFRYAEIE
jgi:DNA-3-methyladenine glycosylase I